MQDVKDDFDDGDEVSWIDLLNSFSVGIGGRVKDQVAHQRKKIKLQEFKDIARQQQNRVLQNKQFRQFRVQTTKQLKRLDDAALTKFAVSRAEKLWYTASLLFLVFFGWIMGTHPQYVHVIYTISLLVLLPIRFITYYRRNFHYYLADLCYFVNGIMLLYIWAYPESEWLWVSCFSFSFGTLSFAIITWRNSLVLHSIDKTTSTVIHIMPPVVCHTLNHRLPFLYKQARFPATVRVDHWHVGFSVLITTVAYFIWQSLYHYFITWRRKDNIKAGQVTSFEFLRKAYSNTWLGKFVNGLPGPLPVIAFTMIQFGYQLGTMIPCPLWYKYQSLSSLFMISIFACAAYNGATYYIDFYGNRFRKELLKTQKELDDMAAELESLSSSGSSSGKEEERIVKETIEKINEDAERRIEKDKQMLP